MDEKFTVEEVLVKCSLCPGICVTYCPVYNATKIRAAAPNNLARLARRMLIDNEMSMEPLYLCTLCSECSNNCPEKNPLWKAILYVRKKRSNPPSGKIKPVYVGGQGQGRVALISSNKPSGALLNRLGEKIRIYWLDSSLMYEQVIMGYDVSIDLSTIDMVVHDDLDAVMSLSPDDKAKTMHSIEFIHLMNLNTRKIGEYVLHVPCKADGSLVGIATNVFGRPLKILKGCTGGGGGLPEFHSHLVRELVSALHPPSDTVVLSLCSRSRNAFRAIGVQAFTPLELIE